MPLTDAELTLSLTLGSHCPCEYGHWGVAPCSLLVTHRVTGCTDAFNVCASAALVVTDRMKHDQCPDCDQLAATCWSIRPI